MPEKFNCLQCGDDIWVDENDVAHHWGTDMDDIDHEKDADHVAVPDEGSW